MRLPFELALAVRYLRFHRGRSFVSVITLISAAGVATGTAALIVALALMTGFQEDLRERVLRGSAHLTLLQQESLVALEPSLLQEVESVPGVQRAGPVLYTDAMLVHESFGIPAYAQLVGVDPARHNEVAFGMSSGGPLEPLEGANRGADPMVLGAELAGKISAVAGERVRALVPQFTLGPFAPVPRTRLFEVRGTFQTGSFLQDSQKAYVRLDSLQSLLRARGKVSWVEVRVRDLRRLDEVKEALRRRLGGAWIVVDMLEQNRDFVRAMNTEKLALFLAIGLIVVVAALNIVSTLILMVHDKVRDIGTLTAMGARPSAVAAIFMAQGLVIGLVGCLAGSALGVPLAWWLDRHQVIRLDPEVYYLFYVPFRTRPEDLLFVFALGLGVSLLATIYPAWKAATLNPVEALRHE